MSLTAGLSQNNQRVIGGNVDPTRLDRALENEPDVVDVTCGACGVSQRASGRAGGYTCDSCGETWRVMKCRECRKASLVLDGVSSCPRCGHDHLARPRAVDARMPAWLTEPVPLSIWLGSVKYLGGLAHHGQPVPAAGLLLDRRGIHLRAFAELFSIEWQTVRDVEIEGPQDISERLSTKRLLSLGASTWVMQVAYLTVRTKNGDAIFEVDGLGPPELHARLSRVIQGLKQSERFQAPIAIERPAPAAPNPNEWVAPSELFETRAPEPRTPEPAVMFEPRVPDAPATFEPPAVSEPRIAEPLVPEHRVVIEPVTAAEPATTPAPAPLAIDVRSSETPIEVIVIDALWKLSHLRETGLIDETEVQTLRTRLLAQIPDLTGSDGTGPLLHV